MTTAPDMLYHMGGVPVGSMLTQGSVYHVKPYHGVNAGTGKSLLEPWKTLVYAQSMMTADQNDVCLMYAESNTAASTTDYLLSTAPLVWSKDFTHLIGVNAGPSFAQRSRVGWDSTTSASSDTVLATFSADCCFVANMEFFCGINDANLSFNVLVSGSRNHFKNCHFAGIGHATNNASGAYSLKVTGSENLFEDCVIGLDTIVRSNTGCYELDTIAGRNIYRNCTILTYSETAGRCSVKVDNPAGGTLRWVLFENCKFINFTVDLATGQTNVFDMPASGSTSYCYLHNCGAFGGGAAGIGSAWADTDTSIFVSMPIPNTAGGKALAAT